MTVRGTLNASDINTGTLNASNITVTNLSASSITTGALNAGLISTGTLNASNITVTNLDANSINNMTLTTGSNGQLSIGTSTSAGNQSVLLGPGAGGTGLGNTSIGKFAGGGTTGTDNVAIGQDAGNHVTSGSHNINIGSHTGRAPGGQSANKTGDGNIGIGACSASEALNNPSLFQTYNALTSGNNNVSIGRGSGAAVTTASNNLFLGTGAGQTITTGGSNICIKSTGGTTGSTNVFIQGGSSMTTGSKNVIIGAFNGNENSLDIRTSSNNIVLSDGDSNIRLYINSSGNVGINRTSPNGLLHMQSPSGTDSALYIQTSAATDDSVIHFGDDGASSVGSILYDHSTNSMQFETNSSSQMRINNTGQVGINRTSFLNTNIKLEVGGADNVPLIAAEASGVRAGLGVQSSGLGLYVGTTNVIKATSGGAVTFNSAFTFPTADGSANQVLQTDGSGALTFATPSTTDLSDISTAVKIERDMSSNIGIELKQVGLANANMIAFKSANNATLGGIISSTLTSSTTYGTSSDYRLKTDIQDMSSATSRLLALKPINFKWIAGDTRADGFLAHEVAEVVPEAVVGEKDGTEIQLIDQSKLIPILVKTIQELEARITALESS